MGKTGKISSIKKEYSSTQQLTLQSELAKTGRTRIPGTSVFKYPYLEKDNHYRTGLDEDASYIRRIQDDTERELEIERVKALRKKLEASFRVDLGPHSEFWNYGKSMSSNDNTHVQPAKLMDGDNYFDLGVPWQELTYAWLRVHPTIASSYSAWERGEYPADTQFYVSDDEIEGQIVYKKKQLVNKAIGKFQDMSPDRRKKVARMLGLPVTDESKEELVYNEIDNLLKQTEFKNGKHQGLKPIEVFNRFADMKEDLLTVKDLVKQAIANNIYRVKPSGKITEGEAEIARDEDELVKFLIDDDNQEDRILLEQQLKRKKLAAV